MTFLDKCGLAFLLAGAALALARMAACAVYSRRGRRLFRAWRRQGKGARS